MRLATYASVATALSLILAKLVAWFVSDSVSILATLVDSSLDLLASMVNLVAVHHALQPADREHRSGTVKRNRWPAWANRCLSRDLLASCCCRALIG
jgi:divalent metal cation (Fe/Co/Zn/Cd) transporter